MCDQALGKKTFGNVREAFSQPKGGHDVSDFNFEWFRAFVVIGWHVNALLFTAAQVKVNSWTAQEESINDFDKQTNLKLGEDRQRGEK